MQQPVSSDKYAVIVNKNIKFSTTYFFLTYIAHIHCEVRNTSTLEVESM